MLYDVLARETDDEDLALAKDSTNEEGVIHYFVRAYSPHNKEFVNPWGLYHMESRVGGWRKTNPTAFKYYVKFLETKNVLHLRNAERSHVYDK